MPFQLKGGLSRMDISNQSSNSFHSGDFFLAIPQSVNSSAAIEKKKKKHNFQGDFFLPSLTLVRRRRPHQHPHHRHFVVENNLIVDDGFNDCIAVCQVKVTIDRPRSAHHTQHTHTHTHTHQRNSDAALRAYLFDDSSSC